MPASVHDTSLLANHRRPWKEVAMVIDNARGLRPGDCSLEGEEVEVWSEIGQAFSPCHIYDPTSNDADTGVHRFIHALVYFEEDIPPVFSCSFPSKLTWIHAGVRPTPPDVWWIYSMVFSVKKMPYFSFNSFKRGSAKSQVTGARIPFLLILPSKTIRHARPQGTPTNLAMELQPLGSP